MSDLYIIDTNSFGVFSNYYPSIFPSFWGHVDALIKDRKFQSVWEVKKELDAKYDNPKFNDLQKYRGEIEFRGWYQSHKHIFVPPHSAVTNKLRDVLDYYSAYKGGADPHLIAEAIVKNGTVVTEEKSLAKGKVKDDKIPTVCRDFGVRCVNAGTFMHEQNWRF